MLTPFAQQPVRRPAVRFRGGRLVLHKRKPLRDPQVAINMALIRARGSWAPGNRRRMNKILDEVN